VPIRIQLADRLFPVQTFFNSISDFEFWEILDHLKNKAGYTIDVCHCRFPIDLDYDEEPFIGVRFSIYEDSVIISEEEFELFLNEVAIKQVGKFPDQRSKYQEYFGNDIT